MKNWLFSSVQQYSLDCLRVSMSKEYSIADIEQITFQMYDADGTSVTSKLKSVKDSNQWVDTMVNTFELYLNKNSSLEPGKYTIQLYEGERNIYSTDFSIEYMEDIRTTFDVVKATSLDTLHVSFKLLDDHDQYQSIRMLKMMSFSLMNEDGTNHASAFEDLSDALDRASNPTKEFDIKLKAKGVLPNGYFAARLACPYKSRNFSIIREDYNLPYMTTTPPEIGSASIMKNSSGEMYLNTTFKTYIEESMYRSATRSIIDPDGNDITSYFDGKSISVTNMTIAGIRYITNTNSPLSLNHYTLKKGKYTIRYSWDNDFFKDISYEMTINWCLQNVTSISLHDLEYVDIKLPSFIELSDLYSHGVEIEVDGISKDASAFGKIVDIDDDNDKLNSNHFKLMITDKTKLLDGVYSFLFYHTVEDKKVYDYMGQLSFKDELMPIITEVYKSSIDKITVVLKKPIPIEVLEYCSGELFDSYGNIDFSSRLDTIRNSNVWEAGQTNADRFDIIVKKDDTLSSGSYTFNLLYGIYHLDKKELSLQWTEARKGVINSVEQTSLSEITIHFSETQSRQFLLSTVLNVKKVSDGQDVTNSFELLENVIKSDQTSFKDVVVPVRNNRVVPSGKYRVSILYEINNEVTIVYACDANLGYMMYTNPDITNVKSSDIENNRLQLTIGIDHLMERELLKAANVKIYRSADIDEILTNNQSISDINKTYMKNKAKYDDLVADIEYLQKRVESNTAILEKSRDKELPELKSHKDDLDEKMLTLETENEKLNSEIRTAKDNLKKVITDLKLCHDFMVKTSGVTDDTEYTVWTTRKMNSLFGKYIDSITAEQNKLLDENSHVSDTIAEYRQVIADAMKTRDDTKDILHEEQETLDQCIRELETRHQALVGDSKIEDSDDYKEWTKDHITDVFEDYVNSLDDETETVNSDIDALNKRLNELYDLQKKASDERIALNKSLRDTTEDFNTTTQRIITYHDEIVDETGITDEKTYEEWTTDYIESIFGEYALDLHSKVDDYKKQNEEYQNELDTNPNANQAEIKEYIKDNNIQIATLEEKIARYESILSGIEERKTLTAKIDDINKAIDDNISQNTEYSNQINEITKDDGLLAKKTARLTEISKVQTSYETFFEWIDKTNDSISKIDKYEDIIESSQSVMDEYNQKINDYLDEEGIVDTNRDRINEITDIKDTYTKLNQCIQYRDKYQNEITEKSNAVALNTNKLSEYNTDYEQTEKDITSLTNAITMIESQNTADSISIDELTTEKGTLESSISDAEKTLKTLTDRANELNELYIDATDCFDGFDDWEFVTWNIDTIVSIGTIRIKSKTGANIESGKYTIVFSWADVHPYVEDVSGSFELNHKLPKTVANEVVSFDPATGKVRLYFEFDKYLQRSFFTSLQVRVYKIYEGTATKETDYDEVTEYFDTIANSNTFDESVSEFNSVNLDVLSLDDIQSGAYSFVFYHVVDGMQSSCYEGVLDIYSAIAPVISEVTQGYTDANEPCLHVTLQSACPRMLLENFNIAVQSLSKIDWNVNYTEYFRTIAESNDWSSDVRDVAEFDIVLKIGYKIDEGNYEITILAGTTKLDWGDFTLKYMENTKVVITKAEIKNLSTLVLKFGEPYSKNLLSSMSLGVYDENGTEVSDKFNELSSILLTITEDYTNNFQLTIKSGQYLEAGSYSFIFQKEISEGDSREIASNAFKLPYLSSSYPLLYDVEATKIDTTDGERDGLIMVFEPPIELNELNAIRNHAANTKFSIQTVGGTDITKKFVDIQYSILDTTEEGNTTFVNSLSLQFDPTETLKKAEYIITFDWVNNPDYSFMKPITRNAKLEYILLPIDRLVMTSIDNVEMYFDNTRKIDATKERIMNSELEVTGIYQKDTPDGTITTDVDFTKFFQLIEKTNNLNDAPDPIQSLSFKLLGDNFLPESRYRFMVKEKNSETSDDLKYAYAGFIKIDFMINPSILQGESTIKQTNYNELTITFSKDIPISILNAASFVMQTSGRANGELTLSQMFKSIRESNYYEIKDKEEKKVLESGYYQNCKKTDLVVGDITYMIEKVDHIYLRLNENCAIAKGSYAAYISYSNAQYFKNNFSIEFMTDKVPEIASVELVDDNESLAITFSPCADPTSILASKFAINKRIRAKKDKAGNVIINEDTKEPEYEEKNMNAMFGGLTSSTLTTIDSTDYVTYVTTVNVPLSRNAALPCGIYQLVWTWSSANFFPVTKYTGALQIVSKGIKSVMTEDMRTLKIVFDEEYKGSFIKGLTLGVMDSDGIDKSDLFQEMEDSNSTITNDTETDTYYIKVAEGGIVTEDLYTFSLSTGSEGEDPEDTLLTSVFSFQMSIVYLADEFPAVDTFDNISGTTYEIVTITNDNATKYTGRTIQLMEEGADKTVFTKDMTDIIGQEVKLYSKPEITTLSMVLSERVDSCLLLASKVSIVDSEGGNYSEYFEEPSSCNTYKSKKMLDYFVITFDDRQDPDDLERYEFNVYDKTQISDANPTGDISDMFLSITNGNELEEGKMVSQVRLVIDEDEYVEEYRFDSLTVTITDPDVRRITDFSYSPRSRNVAMSDQMDIILKSDRIFPEDTYSVNVSYTNEPNMENAKYITAFTYTGKLPFLASDAGSISVQEYNISTLQIVFSVDIPISVIDDVDIEILNEDCVDVSEKFKSIKESTDIGSAETVSGLSDPNTVYLTLEKNQFITSGNYTIRFNIDTMIGDEDDENFVSPIYTLWEETVSLPYMINETISAISSVEITDIDTVKFNLTEPIDIEMIRNFQTDATNVKNDFYADSNYFRELSESNNLGRTLTLSDDRYVLYSEDGSTWQRFNTKQNTMLNDIYYDAVEDVYIVGCSDGKILLFKDFSATKVAQFQPVTTAINEFMPIGAGKLIAVGDNGVILSCSYTDTSFEFTTIESGTTNHLKSITKGKDNQLIIVGSSCTILGSSDLGVTWKPCTAATTTSKMSLTSVCYYDGYTEEDGTTATKKNMGFYIVGTNGALLRGESITSEFKQITTSVVNTLHSITSNEETLIAVGDAGKIITSKDGENWTLADSGCTYTLKCIAYCDVKFIACSSTGKWLTSANGEVWTKHSTIYTESFTRIRYVNSQYDDNRSCKHFFAKLSDGKSIGSINYYTGKDEPTLTNYPARSWISDTSKKGHVGDIYSMITTVDGVTTKANYQFDVAISEDDGLATFNWVLNNAERPFTGTYKFGVHLTDEENTLWNTSPNTDITYLTANPGVIETAKLVVPTSTVGVTGTTPYLEIKMTDGDEMAISYASYRILNNADGREITNYFTSLRSAELIYESNLTISGVKIEMKPECVSKLEAGDYKVLWQWSAFSYKTIPVLFNVKPMMTEIQSVSDHLGTTDNLVIKFNHFKINKDGREVDMLPREFFTDGISNKTTANIEIYKYPENDGDDDTINYSSAFMDLLETNVFDEPIVETITMRVREDDRLPKGKYLIRFSNPDYPVDQSTDKLIIPSFTFEISQELISTMPEIETVKVMQRYNTVEPLYPNRKPDSYSGSCDPDSNSELKTITLNWKGNTEKGIDDTRSIHVGDTYTNTNTLEEWSFVYDSVHNQYRWDKNVAQGYLIVSFGSMKPTLDNVLTNVQRINLVEVTDSGSSSLISYIDQNPLHWDYDAYSMDNVRYMSKLKIPIYPEITFPGTKNGTFYMDWNPGCVYPNLSISELNLDAVTVSFGNIKYASVIVLSDDNNTDETAIVVKFEHDIATSFLETCSFSLTYDTTNDNGDVITEDVSGAFQTISGANYEIFKNNKAVDEIYLRLTDGNSIDGGEYTLTITGEDYNSVKEDKTVEFTYPIHIDWLTTTPPKDIGVKFSTNEANWIYPVLTISFKDVNPPFSVVNDTWATVHRVTASKSTDYSSCFRATSGTIVMFHFEGYTSKGFLGNWKDGGTVEELPEKHTKDWMYKVVTAGTYNGLKCSVGDWIVCVKSGTNKDKKADEHWKKEAKGSSSLGTYKVESIDIPMSRGKALKSGRYEVWFSFNATTGLGYIPSSKKVHRYFNVESSIMSIIATIKGFKVVKHKKLTINLAMVNGLKTNGEIAKSQLGKALGVKTKAELLKKMKLCLIKGEDDKSDHFKAKPKVSGDKITYTLKDNTKVNPGKVTISFKWNGNMVANERTYTDFNGLIIDKVGGGKTKHVCFILLEKHNGRTRRKVFKTFAGVQSRIAVLKKLNASDAKQYAKCKKCRKNKVLVTSKIKADMEKYDIPKKNKGKIREFMKKAFTLYYKQVITKKNEDKSYTVNCNRCDIHTHPSDEDGYCYVYCDNYVKHKVSYTWEIKIANMASAWPKQGKTIHFAYIVKNDEQLARGFTGGTGKKKPKKFKSRIKAIKKFIKSYKKKVAVCRKCKKRTIAEKANNTIGWGAAMFPNDLNVKKFESKITKLVNKAFKAKGMGCAKANFTLVKKDNKHCRLTCKKCKVTDTTMKYGSFKAIMAKK